ncbi:hypothetical protein MKZ38_007987 [Zalerion maritima]|uniref:Uncharacterized protein n=1 Tax=Zalerion maritima TaxID=339359 RepID=A0AAD5RW49_9PEZI|nr:hypothetical protein MKZ38_007987 [Zalerion maritima]
MKTEIATILAITAATSSAREIRSAAILSRAMKREVPQEHSHRQFIIGVKAALELDNRFDIVDPVFSLLGNAAAEEGAGDVENLDCFQQIIADEAFTNALAIDDLEGLTNALIFRTLEKNTLTVGEASVLCDEDAINPEIAALSQHQDPASDDADAINAAIELELARQLATIGADPLMALMSATFEAGEIGDPTGAGNSCNDETDDVGCIFTEDLLTPAVSEEEILDAVADIVGDADANVEDEDEVAAEVEEDEDGEDADVEAEVEADGVNIQSFAGDLGGAAPPVIQSDNERPFEVNGATFLNAGAALERSCAVQNNACSNAVNSGQIEGDTAQCLEQESACRAQAGAAVKKMRRGLHARQDLNFGSCSDPSIQFAEGLDGRNEASFGPANAAEFNHGSANAIRIISDFICGQLGSSCGADADTVAACEDASSAAQDAQAAGQDGVQVAQVFNGALGA